VDPHWRFSVGTVPTRSSLTMPGGLPFGFVIQPFAAPEDRARYFCNAVCRVFESRVCRCACREKSLISLDCALSAGGYVVRETAVRAAAPSETCTSLLKRRQGGGSVIFAGTSIHPKTSRARRPLRHAASSAMPLLST
jgi:hypothetical protein